MCESIYIYICRFNATCQIYVHRLHELHECIVFDDQHSDKSFTFLTTVLQNVVYTIQLAINICRIG